VTRTRTRLPPRLEKVLRRSLFGEEAAFLRQCAGARWGAGAAPRPRRGGTRSRRRPLPRRRLRRALRRTPSASRSPRTRAKGLAPPLPRGSRTGACEASAGATTASPARLAARPSRTWPRSPPSTPSAARAGPAIAAAAAASPWARSRSRARRARTAWAASAPIRTTPFAAGSTFPPRRPSLGAGRAATASGPGPSAASTSV
jgi:hypothetical protein